MSPERTDRRARLFAYTREEIQKLEAGEITRLPTGRELADRFGYRNEVAVRNFLNRQGIKLREYTSPYRLPEQSPDLAWFIGILCAGGIVDYLHTGRIRLSDTDDKILVRYKLVGERLFLLNAKSRLFDRDETYSGVVRGYVFDSMKAARFLGDLGRDSWTSTILSHHPWVISDSQYIWGFINGFFEKKGVIYAEELSQSKIQNAIILWTPSQSAANLLTEMLVRADIRKPTIIYTSRTHEKTKGVGILDSRDIKYFAQHIQSEATMKEELLEYYRTRFTVPSLSHPGRPMKFTREKMIEEWRNIRARLIRIPNFSDIIRLNKEKVTEISASTYARRFGQGSFVKAREELERIIIEGS